MGHAQAAGKPRDALSPCKPVPVERCRLARNNLCCFAPRSPLQCITGLDGHQVERSFETWFQTSGRSQAFDLDCRRSIVALLQISIDEVFDRVTKLVPNVFAFLAGGIL